MIGFAGKVVIDRIFSMIFLSQITDTGFNLKDALSNNDDFTMEEIDKYAIGEKWDTKIQENGNVEEDINEENITERKETEKEPEEVDEKANEKVVNIKENLEESIKKNNSMVSNEEREKQPEIQSEAKDGIQSEAKDEIQSEVKDEIKNEINSEIQDEIIDEIVNEIEKTDNTKQDNDTIKINKEKIVKAEKEISTSDKLKALDIILKKLKSSDIEKLIGMLKKGKLSKEDINNAKG